MLYLVRNKVKALTKQISGSIENAGYTNGVANWDTHLGTPKNK